MAVNQEIVKQQANTFRSWLEGPNVQRELARAIRTQIRPEVVSRIVISAMVRQPKLFDCTRESLWASMIRSLECGLLPDGVEAALVPYKGACTFQPMYQGLVKLVSNAGAVVVPPVIVYANEPFKDQRGSNPPFQHQPLPPSQRGAPVACYAVCVVGGHPVGDFMWKEEIYSIRDRSAGYMNAKKVGSDNPWTGPDELEMWKKTVFKRLQKYCPKSAELARALAADDEAELGTIDTSYVVAGGGTPQLPEGVIDQPTAPVEPEQPEPQKSSAPAHDPCRDIRSEVREAIKELGEAEAKPIVDAWEKEAGVTIAEAKDPDLLAKLHDNLRARQLVMVNEKGKARRGGNTNPPTGNGELIPGATKPAFKG